MRVREFVGVKVCQRVKSWSESQTEIQLDLIDSVRKSQRRTDKHLEAVEVSEEAVAIVDLADQPHDQLLVDL